MICIKVQIYMNLVRLDQSKYLQTYKIPSKVSVHKSIVI